ncbi:MAG: hypothetical protein ABH876_00370 [Patescibacteria group bacterium]|nr:hypothetical protein [Patescibacteria group bacterium]MBU1877030.1 hypothetical protein [Patescibacteria group bacterium]
MKTEIRPRMLVITDAPINQGKPVLLVGCVKKRDPDNKDNWIVDCKKAKAPLYLLPTIDQIETLSIPSEDLIPVKLIPQEDGYLWAALEHVLEIAVIKEFDTNALEQTLQEISTQPKVERQVGAFFYFLDKF